jgi:peptide deformylase
MQHEIDHLDGKVFIEKLSFLKRKKFEKEWAKRQKEA